MSDELPPVRCDDESTWRHIREKIDLPRLLQLIEENGGPEGLDLHGCDMDGIDARPEALLLHLPDYRSQHGQDARPPWLTREGSINLRAAHLENAILSYAHLENGDLRYAHLENAILLETHLERAHLWEAHLECAHLAEAHLEHASLYDAHLTNAYLGYAHLENVNLEGSRLYAAFWYGSYLDRTRMRRDSLGHAIGDELSAKGRGVPPRPSIDFHRAREAYLALKTNFESLGRYDDAAWAYVKERRMEKAALFKHLNWRTSASWLFNWLADALAGYGEHWWKPPLWAAVLSIVAFPLLYWATGALPGHARAFTSATPSNIDWAGWGDSIIFSMTSFATLAFNRLQPEGALANILAASEAATGVLLFALFVFTLGNRMRRS